jgi:hypothetical protein
MAISAILLKCLSYDIIRQTQMDACVVDNDAATCYDPVIPSIAMIKSHRAGVPRKATHVFLPFSSEWNITSTRHMVSHPEHIQILLI